MCARVCASVFVGLRIFDEKIIYKAPLTCHNVASLLFFFQQPEKRTSRKEQQQINCHFTNLALGRSICLSLDAMGDIDDDDDDEAFLKRKTSP